MLPVRDDNPQLNKPIATYCIVAANILAWVLIQGMGGDNLGASICQWGLIPADLFSSGVDLHGSNNVIQTICPPTMGSGWLGPLSSMFMHGGWMHLIGNMWMLWVFGDNVEDSMGSVRFVIFYLLSGFCAAAFQVFSDVGSVIPMVGASGAIGGVMGAYIMLYPRVKVHIAPIPILIFFTFKVPAMAMLGYWIVVQILGALSSSGATGGVAFWAHIGGFVGGAVLALLFKDDELLLNHPHHGWKQQKRASNIWDDPDNQA